MNALQAKTFNFTYAIQWLARGLSIVSIFGLLLFFIGEGFNPATLGPKDWALMIFFPLGVVAGIIIAWRREGLGGVITVSSLVAFYLAHLFISGGLPRGWAFIMFASPGFLFLAHWLFTRRKK